MKFVDILVFLRSIIHFLNRSVKGQFNYRSFVLSVMGKEYKLRPFTHAEKIES